MSALKTKVLAVTETWLELEMADLISVQGFNFEHKARPSSVRRGGVGFFIDSTLN